MSSILKFRRIGSVVSNRYLTLATYEDEVEVNPTAEDGENLSSPPQILADTLQFDLPAVDGAERLPLVQLGSVTPVADDNDEQQDVCVSEAGSKGVFEFVEEPEVHVVVPRVTSLREALLSLDRLHLSDRVKQRACLMRNVLRFLKGFCRSVLSFALEEASAEQLCPGAGIAGGAVDERETTWNAQRREPRCWLRWANLLPDRRWRAHY